MEARLKIGITCYPSLGGSGVVATELGKLLAEKGHQVHFITHSMPFRLGTFRKNIFYHEVEVRDYYVFKYPPYDLSLASKMAQVAKMHELDILHVHYALPHAVCAYLAKQMVGDKLKVVTTLHGTDITILAQDESLSDLIRLAVDESDAVTAVSDNLIEQMRSLLHIRRPIDRIYNFVDTRVYFPRDCADYRKEFARPDEKILMHISNFRPVKRALDVVDVFHRVRERIPSKLLFVGEGPDLSKAHDRVQQLGLEDHVYFLGKQDDIAQVISLADLMLLPSEKESFGLVALEAMACGVPTVGSNAEGIPELITHGKSGLLANVGNTEQMAENALALLSDPDLYASYVEACLERASQCFGSEAITQQYIDVYERVLHQEREDKSLGSSQPCGQM